MNCPKCKIQIPHEKINIKTDVGHCTSCDHLFKISEHLDQVLDNFDIHTTPKGTWHSEERDVTIIGASTRSPIALFLVPFMLIWSGGSLGGIYGFQIIEGEFNLLISLFGIPFILGSIFFWGIAFMAIWGKVEARLDRQGGSIFTGIGSIGRTKKFSWQEVSSIHEKHRRANTTNTYASYIALEGKRRITFGTGLNESRRFYLLKSFQSIHGKVKSNKHFIR